LDTHQNVAKQQTGMKQRHAIAFGGRSKQVVNDVFCRTEPVQVPSEFSKVLLQEGLDSSPQKRNSSRELYIVP